MSNIAPSVINNILGGQASNVIPVTEKIFGGNSKIVKKHYYDHYHYDNEYS